MSIFFKDARLAPTEEAQEQIDTLRLVGAVEIDVWKVSFYGSGIKAGAFYLTRSQLPHFAKELELIDSATDIVVSRMSMPEEYIEGLPIWKS